MGKNYRIPESFYNREDVITIAKELLGKQLVSYSNGQITSGIIIETEAYNGIVDKASHAYGGRRTKRTETMYRGGGIAYIYLCYGIHSLLNVVTNRAGIPHAVLIRGIYPLAGQEIMSQRIGRKVSAREGIGPGKVSIKEGIGPGKVTKLLGLTYADDGEDLINGNKVWIEDSEIMIPERSIMQTPRIGVGYAGEDSLLPYRFVVTDIGKLVSSINM